jgi:hypothetical protein
MSKRCQCVGKKMALLVLRRVGPDNYRDVGQNQMCHFVRLAFWVLFLSVYCCSVGRLLGLRLPSECEKTIHKLHVNMRIKTEKTKGIKLFF